MQAPSRASMIVTAAAEIPIPKDVIDLTTEDPNEAITDSESTVKRPGRRPRKLSDAHKETRVKPPVGVEQVRVERPVRRSRKAIQRHSINNSRPKNPQNELRAFHARNPSHVPARPVPRTNDDQLAAALTYAFSRNADAQCDLDRNDEKQNLVGALSSAFTGNAVPDSFSSDEELGGLSLISGSESEPAHGIRLPERRRRRISTRATPPHTTQIPSPVKRAVPPRAAKVGYVAPSESTMREELDVENLSIRLPLGFSVAPENESEYMDPNDDVLLDYDSSAEVEEKRKQKKSLELSVAPIILRNNLRFLQARRGLARDDQRRTNTESRYDSSITRGTWAYIQRVDEYCGEEALDWVWTGRQGWDTNRKPKEYQVVTLKEDSIDNNPSDEESESEQEAGEKPNRAVPTPLRKRPHAEGEQEPIAHKRAKAAHDILSEHKTLKTTVTKDRPCLSTTQWAELLQKLVKGKNPITEQELQEVLLHFGNVAEQLSKQAETGIENQQLYGSIWKSLEHIAQSAAGALGIPGYYEGTLQWEAKKIINKA
ncbi:hypothetical protein D9757_000393 [Collybiopsis confluens]|uniref:Uncharacterized protein n=1 Tax=Collybiopsis confluens TaxID=2823264 RepID=A0A8H5MH62_9AGAR|nr:hypothetical protein D9757_000393 [Collybiopsis confluens]